MVSEKSKNRNSTLAEKFHIDDHKPKNNKTENGLAEGWFDNDPIVTNLIGPTIIDRINFYIIIEFWIRT